MLYAWKVAKKMNFLARKRHGEENRFDSEWASRIAFNFSNFRAGFSKVLSFCPICNNKVVITKLLAQIRECGSTTKQG